MDPWGYAVHVAEAYGLKTTDAAVLAALYRGANDRGIVKRGMRRLADETRLSIGPVHAAIHRLCDVDVVSVIGESKQFGNTYRVDDVLSSLPPSLTTGGDEGGPTVREPNTQATWLQKRGKERR
jgi:hypothetical protein